MRELGDTGRRRELTCLCQEVIRDLGPLLSGAETKSHSQSSGDITGLYHVCGWHGDALALPEV